MVAATICCFAGAHSISQPSATRRRVCQRRLVSAAAQQGHHQDAAEVAVVGAGAAGLSAAWWAAAAGAQVTVLEKESAAGKKVLISGGTRCNVLPAGQIELPRDYVTESSSSALRAVFSTWSLEDCQFWLSDGHQIGIRLALEEATGKLFPASDSAAEVRDRLVRACQSLGVRFQYGAGLEGMQPLPGGGWQLQLGGGRSAAAERVVLATGGLSFPKLGTTGDGFRLLQQHGHSLAAPYPALTPLLGGHPGGQQLAGISLYDAQLSAQPAGEGSSGSGGGKKKKNKGGSRAQRSDMLFTHRGYSGPAVLDVSHHVTRAQDRGEPLPRIVAQWTSDAAAAWDARLQEGGAALVASQLRRAGVPQRLAEALCAEAGVPLDRKAAELKRSERAALVDALAAYTLPITGSEGYAKAEVTGGGVPLNQLDCATLESRLLPGLYVVGELVDVFGRIGGFNFYWAWLSGRLAGLSAAEAAAAAKSPRAAAEKRAA